MSPATGFVESPEVKRLAIAREILPDFFHDVAPSGLTLWQEEAHPGQNDDRRLYWRRLDAISRLRPAERQRFEAESRGYHSFSFSKDADIRIAVTGFDPFHLNDHIDQGNPSGLIALQLQGRRFQIGSRVAEIRSIVVPVRYRDFDEGLIENFFAPRLSDLDMVFTVSMGREGFDLEHFPGRRRSVTTPDNEDIKAGGTPESPIVPVVPEGPEFVEFSLPYETICTVGGDFSVTDNRVVTTLEDGEITAVELSGLDGKTAVFGSGGGYLSNEISYRLIRLARSQNQLLPIGHIHTPRMQGFDAARLARISSQCHELITSAIETL